MPLLYQDCTFRYGRRTHPVLNGLNLALAPGHTVLLGPNGAGKSTLLSLGAGAFRPGTGRVGLGRLSASGPVTPAPTGARWPGCRNGPASYQD